MTSEDSPVSVKIYKNDFRAGDDVIKVLLGEVNDGVFCNILSLALQLKQVIHNPCGRKRKDREECGGENVDEGEWRGGEGRNRRERGEGVRRKRERLTADGVKFPKTLCTHAHTLNICWSFIWKY